MNYEAKHWLEKIEDIMNRFNFNKVYSAMETLEWEWVGSETIPPSIEELRKEARRLLNTIVDDNVYRGRYHDCSECGGFRVEINVEEGYLQLSFVVTSWEVWDSDYE